MRSPTCNSGLSGALSARSLAVKAPVDKIILSAFRTFPSKNLTPAQSPASSKVKVDTSLGTYLTPNSRVASINAFSALAASALPLFSFTKASLTPSKSVSSKKQS
ncbi:hypothetical protein ONS95_013816 [Cadophora gregata]|uniref:uncharacterized protein n=1 Tax=Cadophora gregata TaxID=51156 RepID=UPI0026DD763B|nr:uncharacterized protein ONS95_013816 [Cadophora gregata]KAK0114322.1 hypothetical protein ONS95_013816 [Cadophora gregata]